MDIPRSILPDACSHFPVFGGRSFLFPFSCPRLHSSRGKFTGSQRIVSLVVETSETSTTPFIGVGSLMLCVTTSMLLVVVTIPDEALLRCHGLFPWEGGGIRALWLDVASEYVPRYGCCHRVVARSMPPLLASWLCSTVWSSCRGCQWISQILAQFQCRVFMIGGIYLAECTDISELFYCFVLVAWLTVVHFVHRFTNFPSLSCGFSVHVEACSLRNV